MRLPIVIATLFALALASNAPAWAAKSSAGVSSTEMQSVVMKGWSAKHSLMGKDVYNERNEKIGSIDDLILSRDMKASYAIVGVGGFLNMGTHDVAVPMHQLKMEKDRVVFPGASKDALKQMPEFRFHDQEGKEHK